MEMMSFFDAGRRPGEQEPERFYHGLVLGLIADLRDLYMIRSNKAVCNRADSSRDTTGTDPEIWFCFRREKGIDRKLINASFRRIESDIIVPYSLQNPLRSGS